jgi:hypothetical protein
VNIEHMVELKIYIAKTLSRIHIFIHVNLDLPVNWALVLWLSQSLVISVNEEERGGPVIYCPVQGACRC